MWLDHQPGLPWLGLSKSDLLPSQNEPEPSTSYYQSDRNSINDELASVPLTGTCFFRLCAFNFETSASLGIIIQ